MTTERSRVGSDMGKNGRSQGATAPGVVARPADRHGSSAAFSATFRRDAPATPEARLGPNQRRARQIGEPGEDGEARRGRGGARREARLLAGAFRVRILLP